jgi:hypothetical protein
MSSQQGGSPFNSMIQNIMMLSQVKHQQEQMQQQKMMNTIQGFREYTGMLREGFSSPEEITALEDALSQYFPREALAQIRERVAPTLENIRTGELAGGLAEMNPDQRALNRNVGATGMVTGGTPFNAASDQFLLQTLAGPENNPLTKALQSRLAAGMNPGDLASSDVLAGRGDDWHQRTQDIASGQALSSAQFGGLEQSWADMRMRNTHEIGRQDLSQQQIDLQRQSMMMKAEAAGQVDAFPIIEEYGRAVRSLTETRTPRSKQQVAAQAGHANVLAQQLADQWILPAQWYATPDGRRLDARQYSPDEARRQGWRPIAPIIRPKDVAITGLGDWIQR